MAENEKPPPVEGEDDDISTPGYKPPAQKSLDEIQQTDADDESLVRYKKQLLGNLATDTDDSDPRNVVVLMMTFMSGDRKDIELDLTGDVSKLKEKPITIKEGCEYKIKITFRVKKEIVAGLRLNQATYRKGVRVDKANLMVGSYGPKAENHEYTTASEEAPKGMISRGSYTMKSKFTDDDKNIHLAWEWAFEIKKEWD